MAPRSVMVGAKRRAARSIPERGEVAEPGAAELRGPAGGAAKAAIWRCTRKLHCESAVDGQYAVCKAKNSLSIAERMGQRGARRGRWRRRGTYGTALKASVLGQELAGLHCEPVVTLGGLIGQ